MHPLMPHHLLLAERRRLLEESVRFAHLHRQDELREAPPPVPVTLRMRSAADDDALFKLAQLSSRPRPSGWYVVAEVKNEVVAAMPLAGGSALTDPFRPTAHLLPLLELRVAQVTGERRRRLRLGERLGVLLWSRV